MKKITRISYVILALGALTFVYAVSGGTSSSLACRAWEAYLVNLIFWTGIAQGAIVFAAVLNVTRARWGEPFVFLARACAGFLPVSVILYLILVFGRRALFPWLALPPEGKEAWLNFPFLYIRDSLLLAVFAVAGLRWVRRSIRGPDSSVAVLSPAVILLFAVTTTVLSWDLIMSLEPHWVSTLFGGYIFIGAFYSGMAMLVIFGTLGRKMMRLGGWLTDTQFHDLNRLLFAFCLLWVSMFWAQFLTIWYGNLPEETAFIEHRLYETPWMYMSLTVFALGFIVPFVLLLDRNVKKNPTQSSLVSLGILVAIWLERYVLIVPSLSGHSTIPFGWIEGVTTLGFFVLFYLSWDIFMRKFSM